jgi:RimJ/RimL family protein N-acetyltransferase
MADHIGIAACSAGGDSTCNWPFADRVKRSKFVTLMEPKLNDLGQPIGFALAEWNPPSIPSHESIEGRFCRLERLDLDRHTAALFAAFAVDIEARNWTYLSYGPFRDLQDYRNWVCASCLGTDSLFFVIIDLTDQQPVGVASYLNIAPADGTIEVGHLCFSPRLQRNPAATEAMSLMMKRAFELGYRRYEWKCDALNSASRAAAQRFGLSFEGVFRQASVYKGRNRDTAWYAAIDSEWPTLHKCFELWLDPSNFDDSGRQRIRLADLTGRVLKARG